MKRLKMFIRCQSLFEPRLWFDFFCFLALPGAQRCNRFSMLTASSLPLPHLSFFFFFYNFLYPPLFSSASLDTSYSPAGLLFSFSIFSFPACNRDNLINQTMRFFCSPLPARPPPSFHLSSPCIQCFPHTHSVVCATPTLSYTYPPTTVLCSSQLFQSRLFILFRSQYLTYHNYPSHTHTHTYSNFLKPNAELSPTGHYGTFPLFRLFSQRSRCPSCRFGSGLKWGTPPPQKGTKVGNQFAAKQLLRKPVEVGIAEKPHSRTTIPTNETMRGSVHETQQIAPQTAPRPPVREHRLLVLCWAQRRGGREMCRGQYGTQGGGATHTSTRETLRQFSSRFCETKSVPRQQYSRQHSIISHLMSSCSYITSFPQQMDIK